MAWVDSMRLRRRADKLRAVGWINLLLSILLCLVYAGEGVHVLVTAAAWGVGVMGLTHGAAWAIDKHADRVVRR